MPCSSISDHDAVYATVNVRVSKYLPRCKFIRNMKNVDGAACQNNFLSPPLSLVCGLESIDDELSVLNSLTSKCIDHHASLLHFLGLKLSALRHPWCIGRKLEPCKLKEINLELKLTTITPRIPGWPLVQLRIQLRPSLIKQEETFSLEPCHLGVGRKYGKL